MLVSVLMVVINIAYSNPLEIPNAQSAELTLRVLLFILSTWLSKFSKCFSGFMFKKP